MAFDLKQWQQRFGERLDGWRARMGAVGAPSLYGFLTAMSLWPVAEAVQHGEWAALVALGSVTAGVGGNLLANVIQKWQDEADGAQQVAAQVAESAALRAEVEAVLEALDAARAAQRALSADERQWFVTTLQQELAQVAGPKESYTATVIGEGAIAQGAGSTALGAGAVQIFGDVHGNIITGNSNVIDRSQPSGGSGKSPARDDRLGTDAQKQLREKIVRYFSVEELKTLCFDLGIPYQNLGGEGHEAKVRELLAYGERQGIIDSLVAACREQRPHVDW